MQFHPVLQASAVPSTDHSHCLFLDQPLPGLGKDKARLTLEMGLEFFLLSDIPMIMLIQAVFVDFSWNWDSSLKTLQGAKADRICSLECTNVSSTTVHTSGTQRAGNYVCPLTTKN